MPYGFCICLVVKKRFLDRCRDVRSPFVHELFFCCYSIGSRTTVEELQKNCRRRSGAGLGAERAEGYAALGLNEGFAVGVHCLQRCFCPVRADRACTMSCRRVHAMFGKACLAAWLEKRERPGGELPPGRFMGWENGFAYSLGVFQLKNIWMPAIW